MKVKKLNGKSNVLGKNVKKYRELRHLTQRELSDKIALLGVDIYHSDISQFVKIGSLPPKLTVSTFNFSICSITLSTISFVKFCPFCLTEKE